jgi:phage shock protein PspC (stress-responsive transcriptional regulator)
MPAAGMSPGRSGRLIPGPVRRLVVGSDGGVREDVGVSAEVPPIANVRRREGRWVGGVCSGLSRRWGVPVARLRVAFVLSTLVMLLGPVVYAAFLLILPADAGTRRRPALRAITATAQLVAASVGLLVLVILSLALGIFGYGAAAAAAAVLLLLVGAWRRRLRAPAWLLLPVAALTVPAAVVTLGGLSMAPNVLTTRLSPTALREGQTLRATSGLGALEVDLRRTRLPASGVVHLDISAGTAPTVVALPHGRCVGVVIDRHRAPRAWRRVLSVASPSSTGTTTHLFGVDQSGTGRTALAPPTRPRLTVVVRQRSISGALTVRDYQDGVDPLRDPDWPGEIYRIPRPDTRGLSATDAAQTTEMWRRTRAAQSGPAKQVRRLSKGPCGSTAVAAR